MSNTSTRPSEWYDRPLRIVQTVLRQSDARTFDPTATLDYVQRLNGDVLVVNAGGVYAWYSSQVPGHRQVQGLPDGTLEALTTMARQRQVRLLLRVDFRGGHHDVFLRHPEWFSYDANGEPLMTAGLHAANPISPYRNEAYGFPIVRELLERFDVDGIWENAPSFGPLAYGPHTAQVFRRDTGHDLPVSADDQDPAYLAWLQWRYDCVLRHTEELSRLIKGYGAAKAYVPEAPALLDVAWLRRSAQDIVDQALVWDIITAPTFDRLRNSYGSSLQPVPVWRAEEVTKYLKAARPDKTPVILFGPFDNESRYSSVVGQELKLWLAGALAHGGAFWDCTFVGSNGTDFLDQRNQDVIRDYYGLVQENEDFFHDAHPVAEVAVVHSRLTEERFGSDDPREDGYVGHVRGVELMLMENHIPFDILPQAHLNAEALSRYRTVVLPNLAVLGGREAQALREYVAQGGGLVSTYETSLYGLDTKRRQDFALADVFGVRSLGVRRGPMAHAYALVRSRNQITAGLEGTQVCTTEGFTWLVSTTAHAHAHLTLVPEVVPQPPEHAWVEDMETDLPVVVSHVFGSGRSVYFPGQTDKLLATSGHPDYATLLYNAVRWTAGSQPLFIETDAPVGVHVSVTKQDDSGRALIHMINYCGGPRRPITQTQPVQDISVSLRLQTPPSRAVLLQSRRELPLQFQDGRLTLTVPRLDEYEAVVLEP